MAINECVHATYLTTDLGMLWALITGELPSGEKAALECARKVSQETGKDYHVETEIVVPDCHDAFCGGGPSIEYYKVIKGKGSK